MESIRRKLVALSLAAVTAMSVTTAAWADESTGIKGDVTGDGKVTVVDSLMVLRYVCNLEKLTEEKILNADFNDDGKVTSVDAMLIQRSALKITGDLPDDTDSEKTDPVSPTESDTDNNSNKTPAIDPNDPDNPLKDSPSNGYGKDAKEDSSIYVSGTNYSVPVGMTLYVEGASGVSWGSTNTDIATVDQNGLILGKRAGTVQIVALVGNRKRTINLTVTASEPVRTVYASPNSASLGDTVKLIATTDQTRTGVRFDVNIGGTIRSVTATEKMADNTHGIYTWVGYIEADKSGTFDVQTYAQKNGEWKTCDNGESTMFVSSSSSADEVSLDTLRASDKLIDMIARFEGGLSEAEYDPIAYGNVMNYGYGVVIQAGETFYNRASMSEYFADLVNQVNEKIYSRYVNQFLQDNGIKYNQYQFDALVCFVYNLGVYTLQNASLKSILLNCYEPSQTTTNNNTATVIATDGLNLRTGAGTNYSIITTMEYGTKVTIVDSTKVNGTWLKVKTPDGKIGYCSSNYLRIGGSNSDIRNFNYINRSDLITETLAYHHAGGICYWGLLNRRIDEMEMFFYGDYELDGYKNKYSWAYPRCIQ